jgi:hypothetical protein
MEHPFDPTVKTLAEVAPAAWLPLAKRRRRRVTIEDSDVGTIISGATDKLFRVHDEPEYLLHLDFESGHFRSELPLQLRLYNSVFEYRHQRVVLSVPVLLCPAADSPQWNGLLKRGLPGEDPVSTLRYEPIRVWQIPVERLLKGGPGTLALAPISNVPEGKVRYVMRCMKERLSGPKPPRRAADIWAATYVLLGLRYSAEFADALFAEVLGDGTIDDLPGDRTPRSCRRGAAPAAVARRDKVWPAGRRHLRGAGEHQRPRAIGGANGAPDWR